MSFQQNSEIYIMFDVNAFAFHKTAASTIIVVSINDVDCAHYVFNTCNDDIEITEKENLTRYVAYINGVKLRVMVLKGEEDHFVTFGKEGWDLREVKTGTEQEGEMTLIVDQRWD